MDKTKAASEQHRVGLPANTWKQLTQFCAEERFSTAGEAVAALLSAWDKLVADQQEIDRERKLAQQHLDQAAAKNSQAEQMRARAEQLLREFAAHRGLPFDAIELFEGCLSSGIGKGELLGVAQVIRKAGIDVSQLERRFEELGGLVALLQNMTKAAEEDKVSLRRQIGELEAERRRLLQGVDILRQQVVQLDQELTKARAELAEAVEGKRWAELYRDMTLEATGEAGGYLRDLLAKVPPEEMVRGVAPAVAGTVLRVGIQLHKDMEITIPPHPASGRIVPFRVTLGELADVLAPRIEEPAST